MLAKQRCFKKICKIWSNVTFELKAVVDNIPRINRKGKGKPNPLKIFLYFNALFSSCISIPPLKHLKRFLRFQAQNETK